MNNQHIRMTRPLSAKLMVLLLLTVMAAAAIAVVLATPSIHAQEATANCGSSPLHGRTQKVVDAIVAVSNSPNCSGVTAETLSGITFLNLSDESLTELRDGDFTGLTSLERLELDDNSLTALPSDIFDGLAALEQLRLQGNSLAELHSDVFDGLSNLEELRLHRNDLTALPSDVFDGLSALEELHLYGNDLSVLPSDVFDGLSALEELYLYGNDLSVLPSDVFDGLSALEELRLDDNGLTALPSDVFDGLSSLRELRLFDNSLAALPPDVFDGLSSLRELYLEQNSALACIHTGQFDGLSELRLLNLTDTNLCNITPSLPDLFPWGLDKLEELRFGGSLIGESAVGFADYKAVLPALNAAKTFVRNTAELSTPFCGAITADMDGAYHGTVRVRLDGMAVRPNRARATDASLLGDGVCGSDQTMTQHVLWTWQRSADGVTWTDVEASRQPKAYGVRVEDECSCTYAPHADDNGMYIRAYVPVNTAGVGRHDYHTAAFGPLNLRP